MITTQPTRAYQSTMASAANKEAISMQPSQRKNDDKVFFNSLSVQPKLSVGAPDDPLEKEADDMADKVMRMEIPAPVNFSSAKNTVNRKCAHCEEEEKQLQRKDNNSHTVSTAPSIVYDVINSSGGRPLNPDTRSFMESRFNYDFGNVKIHDNNIAAKSADSINALAFTSGNNIVFNSGQYNTNNDSGKKLLAHELTHVMQQNGNSEPRRSKKTVSTDSDFIRRAGKKDGPVDEARMAELAKWPAEAKRVWNSLGSGEQYMILLQMASIYGSDFAKQFLDQLKTVKAADIFDHYFGKGVGPKPEELIKRGFRLIQKDSVHEWWVHPSGMSVTRNYTEDKPQEIDPLTKDEKPGRKDTPTIPEKPKRKDTPTIPEKPSQPESEQRQSAPECREIDKLTDSICESTRNICRIAAQLNDEWSRKKCENAMQSCEQATQRSSQCNFSALPNS